MSIAENKSEENDIKTPVLDRKMIILRYSVEKQLILYAYVLMLLNAIQVNTKVYLGLHIMPYSIIKEVKVRLWSKYDVHFVANNDVNILAGINDRLRTLRRKDIACHCKRQKRYKQEYKKKII